MGGSAFWRNGGFAGPEKQSFTLPSRDCFDCNLCIFVNGRQTVCRNAVEYVLLGDEYLWLGNVEFTE